jgi:hypothetical protein
VNLQLAQLLVVNHGRRAGHQVHGLRGLRERDHFADRRLAAHQRHDAVEAERDAAVRRRAVFERVQEEAESRAASSSECRAAEHVPLHVRAVDSNAAAGDFRAVQRQSRTRARATRSGAVSSSGVSSGRGDVNGWCIEFHALVLGVHSNSGNSVTQTSGNHRLEQALSLRDRQSQRTEHPRDEAASPASNSKPPRCRRQRSNAVRNSARPTPSARNSDRTLRQTNPHEALPPAGALLGQVVDPCANTRGA